MIEPLHDHLEVDNESFDAFIDLLGRLIARRHRMTAGQQLTDSSPEVDLQHDHALNLGARTEAVEHHDRLERAG